MIKFSVEFQNPTITMDPDCTKIAWEIVFLQQQATKIQESDSNHKNSFTKIQTAPSIVTMLYFLIIIIAINNICVVCLGSIRTVNC